MRKVIMSVFAGSALEWYDFGLYGSLAVLLGSLFFPNTDPYTAILATYGVFAVGFLARPLGGMLFGYIGDRYGRRTSIMFSIFMMAIPTAAIGIMPTYETVGIWAPILLTLIRILQGLSVGGSFSGCIAFLVEHSPSSKRGLIGSTSMMSLSFGMLLGSVVVTIVQKLMPADVFKAWGWRIPFLLGILVSFVGMYIKNNLQESKVYTQAKETKSLSSKPIREVFTKYYPTLLLAVGIYLTVTVPFYTLTMFMKSYMTTPLGYTCENCATINLLSLAIATLAMPIGGYFSDSFGRKPVLRYTAISLMLAIYPIFWMLEGAVFKNALISQMVFAFIVGFYMGPIPAVLVELFPTRIRYTGVALSYNFSAAAFGGTAPAIGTWMVRNIGHNAFPVYIIVFIALTVFTLRYYKDSYKEELA